MPDRGDPDAMAKFLFRLPQSMLVLLVRGYRLLLSPWLGSNCRFDPTCSAYSLQALQTHGAALGSYLTLHRLVRCHPFCAGGHDPVLERAPPLFRRLVAGAQCATGRFISTPTDKTSP